MSNIVHEAMQNSPRAHRRGPNGETKINCPACIHQGAGHRPDTRWRGSFKLDGERFLYNCFNCHYATGWEPGQIISNKTLDLLRWSGISPEIIRDIKFYSSELRYRQQMGGNPIVLPDGLKTCKQWADDNCIDPRFLNIAQFLQSLDPPADLQDYYWTPEPNGMALDQYAVEIAGTEQYPTGWRAFPVLDDDLPHRTHKGEEPEPDETVPQHILDAMQEPEMTEEPRDV